MKSTRQGVHNGNVDRLHLRITFFLSDKLLPPTAKSVIIPGTRLTKAKVAVGELLRSVAVNSENPDASPIPELATTTTTINESVTVTGYVTEKLSQHSRRPRWPGSHQDLR